MTFEEHVRAALDSLPPELARRLENVAVVVEEENPEEPDIYGLFDEPEYLPARIAIYRRPLVEDFGGDPAGYFDGVHMTEANASRLLLAMFHRSHGCGV